LLFRHQARKEIEMPAKKPSTKKAAKVEMVMGEYKAGALHSGRAKGPKVKSRKQAIAIALSEAGQSRKRKTQP